MRFDMTHMPMPPATMPSAKQIAFAAWHEVNLATARRRAGADREVSAVQLPQIPWLALAGLAPAPLRTGLKHC